MTTKKESAFTVRLPQEVRIPAKDRATRDGTTLKDVVIEYLRLWGTGKNILTEGENLQRGESPGVELVAGLETARKLSEVLRTAAGLSEQFVKEIEDSFVGSAITGANRASSEVRGSMQSRGKISPDGPETTRSRKKKAG